MKKFDKKKVFMISIFSILLTLVICMILFVRYKDVKKEEPFLGFIFKEVDTLEYHAFLLSDFVEDVECNDTCTYRGKTLEYSISEISKLGENEVTVKIIYDKEEYTKIYQVEVKDTTAPEIVLTKTEDSIVVNTKFDAKSYIESVMDNFDELLIEKIDIESKVDTKKTGDYEVIYKIKDSNQNESKVVLVIHVVASEEEKQENDKKQENQNQNSSNNNNNTQKPNNNQNQGNNNQNIGNDLKSKINSLSLNPVITRYPTLDNKIASIISSVTNSGMSNYDKLVAINNYVKNTLSYQASGIYMNDIWELQKAYHYTYNDAYRIILAKEALDNKTGVCDNYSALFMILARRLGFDAYFIGGEAPNQNGGRGGHAWVTINIGGSYYFFDPQIEDFVNSRYSYFGTVPSKMSSFYTNYNIASAVSSFNYFRALPELKADIKVSGAVSATSNLSSYTKSSEQKYAEANINEKINIEISFGGSSAYTYNIYTTSNESIKKGTSNGEKINVEYHLGNEEKMTTIKVNVQDKNGASVTYTLQIKVVDQSKIKMFSSYSSYKYPSGLIRLTFYPYGGYEPYTYKIDILEHDATENPSVDVSDSKNLTIKAPGATYIKMKVTVKDSKGASYSENFHYDVANNRLKSI